MRNHVTLHTAIRLGGKIILRDWLSGRLSILLFSLLLAVATVTSISLFTSRIQNSIYDEASQLIAADAKIIGGSEIPTQWIQYAQTEGLQTGEILSFSSMAFSENNMILTQTKAVSNSYPLKGQLTISVNDNGQYKSIDVTHGPSQDEVWLAKRVISALNIKIGDTIAIGDGDFIVSAAIEKEPDQGQSLFGVAPRAMIHLDDVPKTQAVQVGSRLNYALTLAGNDSILRDFKQWIEPQLGDHFRWQDIKSGNRSIGSALNRAETFLLLAGSLGVILGGAAIALSARRYAKSHIKTVAVLKTLGLTPKNITQVFLVSLAGLALTSILLGTFTGWFLHWMIIISLGDLISTELALPSISAYYLGASTGLIAFFAFALPPIFILRKLPPIAAININYDTPISDFRLNSLGFLAILGLVYLYSMNIKITGFLILGASVILFGVYAVSRVAIWASQRLAGRMNHIWRLSLNNLKRHQQSNALQIMIFSMLLLIVSLLFILRTQLISQWQNQLPENTANHFVFNIFPDELPNIQQRLNTENIIHSPFYPMTRGRILAVNNIPMADLIAQYSDGGMNYERELNLTWSDTLGDDNKVIAGSWWGKFDSQTATNTSWFVSAEKEYAEGLNIQLGDTVTFSMAGQKLDAKVASIRTVKWDSMNPNFFMIFNQPLAGKFGANWLTSFYLSSEQKSILNQLSRDFPTVSIVELDQTINQIKDIINKISQAIEFIMTLVFIAGLTVLVASIQSTLDMRLKESAILRTLGANKSLVRSTLIIEFATLGALAGVLAAIATEISSFFIQTLAFNLTYQSTILLWFILPIVSAILVGGVGWFSTRKVIDTAPMRILSHH